MDISQRETGEKGSFYIQQGEEVLAEMIYSIKNDKLLIIEHTEVADTLRGKNVGYQLVKRAVEYAKQNHLRIIPLCPFAKSILDKKRDEYKDVLSK